MNRRSRHQHRSYKVPFIERIFWTGQSHHAQAAAVLDHSRALPQRDGSPRPALAGGAEGGECDLIVLDASDMLHDAFAVRGPDIDAEGEVSSKRRGHLRPAYHQYPPSGRPRL